MIIIKNKIVFIGALLFALFVGVSNVKAQMMLDAGTIYRQAKVKNISFLNRISRYNGLIDKTNSNGDTAFCMALKFNDKETAKMLYVHGASSRHNCVERLKMAQQRYNKMPSRAVKPVATSTPALSSGTNYWLLGL